MIKGRSLRTMLTVILLCVAGLVATAAPASAYAENCRALSTLTWRQCIAVNGSGRHIDTVQEGLITGQYPEYICKSQAKWYGNFTATGWTNYYSAQTAGCTWYAVYTGWYTVGNGWIVNNTKFWGFMRSNLTNNAWTPGTSLNIYS